MTQDTPAPETTAKYLPGFSAGHCTATKYDTSTHKDLETRHIPAALAFHAPDLLETLQAVYDAVGWDLPINLATRIRDTLSRAKGEAE